MEAPDGSGFIGAGILGGPMLGRVPDVDSVGEECGELDKEDPLELSGWGCCGTCGDCSVGASAGAGASGADVVQPRNSSRRTEVQLNPNSGTVSGSTFKNW